MRANKFSTVATCAVAILFLALATLPSPIGMQSGKHATPLSSTLPFIQHVEPLVVYKSLKPRIKKQLRRLVQLQHLI